MKRSGLLLIACLLCAPIAAWADHFNYDYVEADYLQVSPQTGDSSKGPGVQLSYTIPGLEIQVLANYARLTTPATPSDITGRNIAFGIRGESAFGPSTSFYTDLLSVNDRTTSQGIETSDNGYRLLLGMRHQLTPRLEWNGSLAHDYLTQSNNEVAVGLVFNATRHLAVGLSYAHDTLYDNTATLRLRLYY